MSRTVNFGDESEATVTSDTLTHSYSQPGVYSVNYDAADSYGGSYEGVASIVVTAGSPLLELSTDPGNGNNSPWNGVVSGTTVDFSLLGLGSTGHSTGVTYRLNYGDGSTPVSGNLSATGVPVDGSNLPVALTHTYATAGGEYTLTASVSDTAGLTTTVSGHVSVAAPPSITLGTPTLSGSTVTIPVTSYSPGTNAVASDFSVEVSSTNNDGDPSNTYFDGAPPSSFTVPVAGGTAPFAVSVDVDNDHGGETESAESYFG